MKKFFYFSEKNLEFVEIKNFNRKTAFSILFSTIFLTLLIFFIYTITQPLFRNDDREKLLLENEALKAELKNLDKKYSSLLNELNELGYLSNTLRSIVNLKPLEDKERQLGKGGSVLSSELLNNLKLGTDVKESIAAIESIVNRFEFEKVEYKNLEKRILENERFYESVPVLIPTAGDFSIDGFGMRLHPILKINRMHEGIDILNDPGTPVYAPGAGRVTYVGRKAGLGISIEIEHGFGYKTVYGHLSKTLVQEGQAVKRGDKIALSGNTGLSTGPHLHYEVHLNGVPQDPSEYFIEHSKTFLAEKMKNKLGGN
jgi:murein DD-endopeptidase MepM/ murein hydrolase activator NlpD